MSHYDVINTFHNLFVTKPAEENEFFWDLFYVKLKAKWFIKRPNMLFAECDRRIYTRGFKFKPFFWIFFLWYSLEQLSGLGKHLISFIYPLLQHI